MPTGTVSTITRTALADEFAGLVAEVSAHTADPTDDGSVGEVAGGSYARQAVTWGAAATGITTAAGDPVASIPIPAGVTVTYLAFWHTGGSICGGTIQLDTPETFGAAGTLEVDNLTMTVANP